MAARPPRRAGRRGRIGPRDRRRSFVGGAQVEAVRQYDGADGPAAESMMEGALVTKVLYPGSFDPFHNGHRELVETAAYLFDTVVIAAMRNPQKGKPLFDLDDRREMILESMAHVDNIRVVQFSKLVVDVAKDVGADFIIKGLRAVSDFEAEMAQAQVNLNVSGVHTVFLPSASASSAIASKYIREIARFGGDVSSMVPKPVARRLRERFSQP